MQRRKSFPSEEQCAQDRENQNPLDTTSGPNSQKALSLAVAASWQSSVTEIHLETGTLLVHIHLSLHLYTRRGSLSCNFLLDLEIPRTGDPVPVPKNLLHTHHQLVPPPDFPKPPPHPTFPPFHESGLALTQAEGSAGWCTLRSGPGRCSGGEAWSPPLSTAPPQLSPPAAPAATTAIATATGTTRIPGRP